MHRLKVPSYSKAKSGFLRWFRNRTFVAERLRDALLGALVTLTVAEVCAYRLLEQNVRAGQLPHYITSLLVLLLAVLEALVSPLLGWFGSNRRRVTLVVACLMGGASSLLWYALPKVDIPESIGYCQSNNVARSLGGTTGIILRLSIILFTFIVFGAARVVIWCHGIAYIDEHAPSRMSMHYGLLATVRLLGLALGYHIFTEFLEKNITLQILMIALGISVNAVQIYFSIPNHVEGPPRPIQNDISETSPFVPKINNSKLNDFRSSVYRIFSNTLAMSMMVATGLVAAGLWGFAYHQSDFLKAKYYIHLERNTLMNNAEALRNHAVVLAIAYMGVKFTAPVMPNIVRSSVLIQAGKMCVASVALYIVMAVISCDTGRVAGLEGAKYIQPSCSQQCGCAPQWQEFSPLCVVDEMITYLSPCHAGCTGVEKVEGLQVFSNCTCAALSRRAVGGACARGSCDGAFYMHQMLYVLLFSASALAIQGFGTVLMRTVEARDRSVLLAIAGSVVAVFTFVFGHLIFIAISAMDCVWAVDGRCHLHGARLPYVMSAASGCMVLFSFFITVTIFVTTKLEERRKKAQNLPEESQI